MTTPFTPADGVMPRWQKLYNLVTDRKVGDGVTYGEARDLLGCNLPLTQAAMRDAQKRLEQDGERTVGTVARFGWIVLDAQRELGQVDRRLTKTRRAAGRVVRGTRALNTRREDLSQQDRHRLDQIARSGELAAQIASRRKVDLNALRKAVEAA